MRDDDYGQVDGDASPAFIAPGERGSIFADHVGGQPWLRSALPPWHMWGNTETVSVVLEAGSLASGSTRQLTKIAYARPESWHWLFAARLISGSPAPVGTNLNVQLTWQLSTGIGRGVQIHPTFDLWNIPWLAGTNAPAGAVLWATQTIPFRSLNRLNSAFVVDPNPPPNIIDQIVGQDIQLNCLVTLGITGALAGYPYNATVEVGAQWAPKTHVRPDWYQLDVPPEAQFAGEEIKGK